MDDRFYQAAYDRSLVLLRLGSPEGRARQLPPLGALGVPAAAARARARRSSRASSARPRRRATRDLRQRQQGRARALSFRICAAAARAPTSGRWNEPKPAAPPTRYDTGGIGGHPKGPDDALLHGDVGAVQLLRHAVVPRGVHGRRDRGRGPRIRHQEEHAHLRHLHDGRLSAVHPRRLPRRQFSRGTKVRPVRRDSHRARPLRPGDPLEADLSCRPHPRGPGDRPPQAERQRAGRRPLCFG